jgi:hypothetical protein
VVAVTVRHDDKVELGQVDALGLDVLVEGLGIVAGVEKDAFAADFDQGGVAQASFIDGSLPKAS